MYNLVDSGLIGFEEDINLDFAVLELQHLRCRDERAVFMQGFAMQRVEWV